MNKKGLMPPNYTAIPNELFDMIPNMSNAELRVMLIALRKTIGYHKVHECISLTQFEKGTGLSRQGVLDGINAAIERGILKEIPARGKRGVKRYAPVYKDDQSTKLTSDQSTQLTSDAATSQASRPVTSLPSRHTKENLERNLKDKETPPLAPAPEKPALADVDTMVFDTPVQQVAKRFEAYGLFVPLTWIQAINAAITEDGLPEVLGAIDIALNRGKPTWSYVEGILRNRRNERALEDSKRAKADAAAQAMRERIDEEMKTKLVLLGVANDAA